MVLGPSVRVSGLGFGACLESAAGRHSQELRRAMALLPMGLGVGLGVQSVQG